jgi:hypothetical protein
LSWTTTAIARAPRLLRLAATPLVTDERHALVSLGADSGRAGRPPAMRTERDRGAMTLGVFARELLGARLSAQASV